MNQLIQHILKKCKLPLYEPDPFLFASMNMASTNGLVVCDLDSSLSDWLALNKNYFSTKNVVWTAFNSRKRRDNTFEITQEFMDQKVEENSVDFQVYNHVLANILQLDQLQKIAYCCKNNGRFVGRELLWFDQSNHERYLQSEVKHLCHMTDETIHKMAIESGFSKCSISEIAYPLAFSSLNDYDKWIRQFLVLLGKEEDVFLGFSKVELDDKDFQRDFIEDQEIIIREIFAVK